MIHFSFKMGGATWFIDQTGPAADQSGKIDCEVVEHVKSHYGEEGFVKRQNMVLDANTTEAMVKSRIRRDYLDEVHNKYKNYKPTFTFLKPAFIR